MKDQYVADVGDLGKYGLLRALTGMFPVATPRLRLGVVWYLTPSDGSPDGRHRSYLAPANAKRFRACDPDLHDALSSISESERSVAAVERSGVLPPDTLYNHEVVPPRAARRVWANVAFEAVAGCDLVFVDPDNGLVPKSVGPLSTRAPKFVFLAELQRGLRADQSIIAYHHLGRNGTAAQQAQRHLTALSEAFPDHAEPWALRFRCGTSRFYLVVPAVQHEAVLRERRDALLAGAWGRLGHFVRPDHGTNVVRRHIDAATLW